VTILFAGRILVSELLLSLVLVHALVWIALARALPAPMASPRLFGVVLACQCVAFASYIISDLWWQSTPFDTIRGWLRMIFLLVDMAAFSLLFGGEPRSFLVFMSGICCSVVLNLLAGPLFGDYWKFGFAYPVTIVGLVALPRYFGFWPSVVGSVGLGLLHSRLDYRSLGAVCTVLGVMLATRAIPLRLRKLLFLSCFLLTLMTLPWTANKMLGNTDGRANRSNVERSAMLQAAWEGFLASPVIGNGSWFSRSNVWDNFLVIRSTREHEAGGGLGFDSRSFEGAAIHSQILTALAEGGVFGATFFFIYGALICWSIWFILTDATWNSLMPIRLCILLSGLWALFMSPFSGIARVSISVTLVLILILLGERNAEPYRASVAGSCRVARLE
jgi:O-Antigen ligase